MWIFLTEGMIYASAIPDKPSKVKIESHRREHLQALFPRTQLFRVNATPEPRFHAIVNRSVLIDLLSRSVADISYESLEDTIRDADYFDACVHAGAAMKELEYRPPTLIEQAMARNAMDFLKRDK